jgi:sulfane dehydrogenase subunit SoxC
MPAKTQSLSAHGTGRRDFLLGAVGASAALATRQSPAAEPLPVPAASRVLGKPVAANAYGAPARYEANIIRRQSPGLTRTNESSIAFSPLQNMFGIITPNGLHFERDHAGQPDIDPHQHRLVVHGLVNKPKIYTMDDILRLPSVSRLHFLECGANSGMEWSNVAVPTVQFTHGMLSCAEYTGVLLSTLLDDVGVDIQAGKYLLAEGADGAGLTRTIPLATALDDVLLVYGQNGEMLRPENGYPLRLVVPGVQGVSSVKWLRRLEVGDQPWHTREETLHYSDLMPDGNSRQFTWIQEAKSVITSPSAGMHLLDRGGYYEITGLAWSGRGRIKQVDISTDGGRLWRAAELQEPVASKALTRFRADWVWDCTPAWLQSRCRDESGYVQPALRQLREVRGTRSLYHNNAIQTWSVGATGEVSNVQL